MELSPVKRALRNSIVISLVVAAIVVYQGEGISKSLFTSLFTFAVTFPALWLSFRYTQSLMDKYKNPEKRDESDT